MKKPLLIVLALSVFFQASAQTTYKYQSVFIYSFTRYVVWPDSYNEGDFEIAVLGDSPILEELKVMAQTKKAGNRTIKVSHIQNVSDIKKYHILYVAQDKSSQLAEVLAKTTGLSTLIVTEEPGLGVKGSNINFIVKDGKLAFELNQASLDRQGLKAAAELTRHAILI